MVVFPYGRLFCFSVETVLPHLKRLENTKRLFFEWFLFEPSQRDGNLVLTFVPVPSPQPHTHEPLLWGAFEKWALGILWVGIWEYRWVGIPPQDHDWGEEVRTFIIVVTATLGFTLEFGVLKSSHSAWEISSWQVQFAMTALPYVSPGQLKTWCHGLALNTQELGKQILRHFKCLSQWVFLLLGELGSAGEVYRVLCFVISI